MDSLLGKNPINMDDLGVPPILGNLHFQFLFWSKISISSEWLTATSRLTKSQNNMLKKGKLAISWHKSSLVLIIHDTDEIGASNGSPDPPWKIQL